MGGVFAYFLAADSTIQQPNEITGLTDTEVKLIQQTWSILKKDMSNSGKELFILLFRDHPAYQRFFKSFADVPLDELSAYGKFQAHAVTVMYALTSFVDNLGSPEVLRDLVHRTARNHHFRGVSHVQFADFTKLLIPYFETKSNRKLQETTRIAWAKVIAVLNTVFEEGIKLAREEVVENH